MKIFLFILMFPLLVVAYPDFISYGYRTCITCHYNGQGGGALNDYGRAVWASEITSQTWTGSKTADELGEESGFLGKTELPWYIRPGIKYRGLFLRTALGSPDKVDRWINMQAETTMAIHLDKKYEKVIVANFGYTPTRQRFSTSNEPKPPNWTSTEYYFRMQIQKKQYLYLGFMDKFYGLKHPDHTAFNRQLIRNSQYDQTHGMAYQYFDENYDLVGHIFFGNLAQSKDLRQAGGSGIFEYAVKKEITAGLTTMFLNNDYIEQKTVGLISRVAFAKGKSFIYELGLIDDKTKLTGTTTTGYYGFMQGLIGMSQGYNFITTFQIYKSKLTESGPVRNRLSFGTLFFPYPKTEFRIEAVDNRAIAPSDTGADQFSLQAQVHLAL